MHSSSLYFSNKPKIHSSNSIFTETAAISTKVHKSPLWDRYYVTVFITIILCKGTCRGCRMNERALTMSKYPRQHNWNVRFRCFLGRTLLATYVSSLASCYMLHGMNVIIWFSYSTAASSFVQMWFFFSCWKSVSVFDESLYSQCLLVAFIDFGWKWKCILNSGCCALTNDLIAFYAQKSHIDGMNAKDSHIVASLSVQYSNV